MSFANVGKSWDRKELRAYLATLYRPSWCKGITFHHTAEPNLAMRPAGWDPQLIRNVADGYQHDRGWNRGPHFFPDDRRAWGLTPPTEAGIHAVAFNRTHLGIEILGDYDRHDAPNTGRGLACWTTGFWTAAECLRWLGVKPDVDSIRLHRQDPTTSKTCPGTSIAFEWALAGVKASMDYSPPPLVPSPGERVGISDWLRSRGLQRSIVRNTEGHVIVGGAWIESASYDKVTETTAALRSELESDIR